MTQDSPSVADGRDLMPLGDAGDQHVIGDADCAPCWSGYPEPCEQDDCPGLVHASFGDYDAPGDYWLYTKCDVCGEPE